MDTVTATRTGYCRVGALAILLAFVLVYVGSFVYCSRFSPTITTNWDSDDYWFDDITTGEGLAHHNSLSRLFWPLAKVDEHLVSGRRINPPPQPRTIQVIHNVNPAP